MVRDLPTRPSAPQVLYFMWISKTPTKADPFNPCSKFFGNLSFSLFHIKVHYRNSFLSSLSLWINYRWHWHWNEHWRFIYLLTLIWSWSLAGDRNNEITHTRGWNWCPPKGRGLLEVQPPREGQKIWRELRVEPVLLCIQKSQLRWFVKLMPGHSTGRTLG